MPAEGGKISINIKQARVVVRIDVDTSANESLTYDKATDGVFGFYTPMAQYRVEEKNGQMEINVFANDSGAKRYDKLEVILFPTKEEKEQNLYLAGGRAI